MVWSCLFLSAGLQIFWIAFLGSVFGQSVPEMKQQPTIEEFLFFTTGPHSANIIGRMQHSKRVSSPDQTAGCRLSVRKAMHSNESGAEYWKILIDKFDSR